MTLAEIAVQWNQENVIVCKRPDHANSYLLTAWSGQLKESDGRLPRLTAGDLTAADWEITETR